MIKAKLVGKMVKVDAEVIIVYRVGKRYYPATDYNKQLFETYLHTGDGSYLKDLEDEVQL